METYLHHKVNVIGFNSPFLDLHGDNILAPLSVRTIYLPLPSVIDGVWANAHSYIVSALYTVVQLMQQSQFTVFLQVICDD